MRLFDRRGINVDVKDFTGWVTQQVNILGTYNEGVLHGLDARVADHVWSLDEITALLD